MVKNFLKLPKKTVDAIERKLARYITADQFLAIQKADDTTMRQFAATWLGLPVQLLKEFEETESQKRARAVMGDNFFGIAAVQRHFGDFTAEELEAHKEVRILNEITGQLFTGEETLTILQECKDTHVLLATKNVALPEMHARHKDRFSNDRDAPFFSAQLEREKWSSVTIKPAWLLVRKNPVPDSGSKDIDAQKAHVLRTLPKERLVLPCEYVFASLLVLLETGKKLCEGYVVRFAVQTADGYWVGVYWDGAQLVVSHWDRNAYPGIVSCTVRTS